MEGKGLYRRKTQGGRGEEGEDEERHHARVVEECKAEFYYGLLKQN